MDISWEAAQLLSNSQLLRTLPEDIIQILHQGSNIQYLDVLARLALDPSNTSVIFFTHRTVFVDLCSRWLRQEAFKEKPLAVLAALARVLPLAPHLRVYVKELLSQAEPGELVALTSRSLTGLLDLSEKSLYDLLLALCRLLSFDNHAFGSFVSPAQLQLLLNHPKRHIRYLAVRILSQYLHASDAALMGMVAKYLGKDEINGTWEDKTIDYAFFSLWEEKRIKDLQRDMDSLQTLHDKRQVTSRIQRIVQLLDLSPATACIGGVLVPRLTGRPAEPSWLVTTKTTSQNLRLLAKSINEMEPLLVTGFSGAGKTSLIRDLARELGKSSTMVTLHLNEQTDAKMLIGMYTSDKTPGSFNWQPGVLTTAVVEGRWVVVEDLDRAPTDIISTLLPLLERGELLIPNWGETIRAAPGFKLISTVRSISNVRNEEVNPAVNIIGFRHWLQVPLKMPSDEELGDITRSRFPILHAYVPKIMRVYTVIRDLSHGGVVGPRVARLGRSQGPRNLFRWCGRLHDLLLNSGVKSGNEPISENTNDYIFLEAVDCFAGMFPYGYAKSELVSLIAQELHMPKERVQYCLEARKPEYLQNDAILRIGRVTASRTKNARRRNPTDQWVLSRPFAKTSQVLRNLESVAMAVKMAEPCLLVGETGTGKTTIIQQLAHALGHSLTVVNLSQQSEAGDLLGGFKPLNIRALAIPIKEEFDNLFEMTFSRRRNQRYIEIVGKAVSKGRWTQALKLWQEALGMVEEAFGSVDIPVDQGMQEPRTKKRKLDYPKHKKLKARWDRFTSDVQAFQMHLSSGSKGFAFSFVEGNIVKAARNGGWVLLDEINLASPDTLENIADLLSSGGNESPSLLLSETGDIERLHAHKDFRIFGAMNPATDVGKRDLPPSFRSRFTEIFIESPDKDLKALTSLVSAYLGSHNYVEVRAASDIAHLYFEIQRFAAENRLVDGADQKPHFSLRTLTRTLVYIVDIAPSYGFRRALFEGFSMSFLTLLSRDSELVLQPLIDKHILGSQKDARALLCQTPRFPENSKQYVQFRHYWIAQGAVPVQKQLRYIITPFVERNLLNLVRATSTRRFPVLLQGPTSSGKTSMVEYLANISGNRFVRINNHEHTDLQEYLGTYVSGHNGRLQYQDGVLVRALREGHWIVLDELNLAPTDVLEALNRLLDDNRELWVPETQQVVRPHENFMLFATQNPPGMYGGRKVLSRAFRNRFLELHFDDIPEDELETILRERSQIAPSFCTKIVAVYKKLSILRQKGRLFEQKNSFATLRDLFRWALRDADDREQLATNGFLLLAERVRNTEERLAVKVIIEDVMKVKINEDQIYNPAELRDFSGHHWPSTHGVIWTKSMRRLFVLVTEALKSNEPVLLVGDTGCGKTTICQVIAEIMQAKLHTVNAHQNMETGDLVGSHRPLRDRVLVNVQLAQELTDVLRNSTTYECGPGTPLVDLLAAYNALKINEPDTITPETYNRVEQLQSRSKALFEWVDGSLVRAMRAGQHFLLDEISLADDSVLERLNSVLEPDRKLLLAEKGTDDALVTASDGFQFLATMNPAGDYGKRELSPALRNRFTEIWVSQTSENEEMLEIVRAKLLPRWTQFSMPMVSFAVWYGTRYNPAAPLTSIRDILAWVQFVNTYPGLDPCFALLQGAAMVYIDGLGANPAAKMSISETSIPSERDACLAKLNELFDYDMNSLYSRRYPLSVTDHSLSIGPFTIRKSDAAAHVPEYSLQAPTTKANAMKLIRALQLQKPILLEGNPGVGKTTLVATLAQAVGMPLTRLNLSEQTDLMDLFGSDVPIEGAEAGHFEWRDAPFLRAMRNGEWVLLDEMNLASQAVLEGLNACLDHRGQVYVAELDQTFSRHPDFVVFAAQNPHHQGGGRKGLPASFVNRFTVVFADAFTPEDLLMICRHSYPDSSVEEVEILTRCVTFLSLLVHRDRRIGAHGGPWEFNLRDVLRWLRLLTPSDRQMLVGSIADYQDILVLQRFRTPDDVAAVRGLLQQYLPKIESPKGYFHNINHQSLQIGLGLLGRNAIQQPVSSHRADASTVNLPIAESIMICIQQNWPCLLVGPSGSGKTKTILQLAHSVGAEIVVLSMNADMDTTDLIGGYGQLDAQRRVSSFVRQMRNYVHTAMIQNFLSAGVPSEALVALEQYLNSRTPDLTVVLRSIRALAEEYPSQEYSRFADECEGISRLSMHDNRARFEWVDGILVKALEEGKWLILDNANLCSPSVLDRLNSLLEPNGFLSINETRSSNGTARIVRPHQNFRLFLTMDPRHGELSRAMRNRSIELFMHVSASSVNLDVMGLTRESSLSRFKLLESVDDPTLDDVSFNEMLPVMFDHLCWSDYRLCARWQAQAVTGLIRLSRSKQASFSSALKLYHQLSQSGGKVVQNILKSYQKLAEEKTLLPDIGASQTIHPYNNVVLLPLTACESISTNLSYLGSTFELLVDISNFLRKLEFVEENVDSRLPAEMTRLERSIVSNNSKMFQNDSTQPLGRFLKGMGTLMLHKIDGKGPEISIVESLTLSFAKEIMFYLSDMFDVAQSANFDEGAFQVYQAFGRSMIANAMGTGTFNGATTDLAYDLQNKLQDFNASWQLSSGLSMETLWVMFRPSVAENMQQLEACLEIEGLADRFDTSRRASGASFEEIRTLRQSIIDMYNRVMPTDTQFSAKLEDVRNAIRDLESLSKGFTTHENTYFCNQFEGLRQYAISASNEGPIEYLSILDLLAGRSSRSMMRLGHPGNAYSELLDIADSTGIDDPDRALIALRHTLPTSALNKLSNITEVPLKSLGPLCEEMGALAQNTALLSSSMTFNHFRILLNLLGRLHLGVLIAHESDLNAESLASCRRGLVHISRGSLNDTKFSVLRTSPSVPQSHHLNRVLEDFLNPSITHMQEVSNECNGSMAGLASAWILFFTGFLVLYVPDRPFDPALKPMIERDRHKKRTRDLQDKLKALRDFEMIFTGQTTSLRSQLVEQNLKDLGEEPKVPAIVRPQVSALRQLQGEFNHLHKSIISKCLDTPRLRLLLNGDIDASQEAELLRSNIAQVISRLSNGYRAYDDITKPLVAMLRGLDVGLAMALLSTTPRDSRDIAIQRICKTTPFLGMRPDYLEGLQYIDVMDHQIKNLDLRKMFLRGFAAARSLDHDIGKVNTQTMFRSFHTLYEEWKEQLGEDQRKDTAKSSMYRYRGGEEDNDEVDEKHFLRLFTDYHADEFEESDVVKRRDDPRIQAQYLAGRHRDVFKDCKSTSHHLLEMLRNASDDIAKLWHDDSGMSSCSVPAANMLPGLILSLNKCAEHLQGLPGPGKLYNFYVDANLVQARRLISLIQKVQDRFAGLKEAWPEYATIQDVIRTSSELLELRHTEPIAKILTKAEQVHGFIHEWQVVASREYSVAALYDQFTALLVDWRRLELSTWARLLDMEDKKCNDDADSWWFIAYEVIVAVPLSMVGSGTDLRGYAEPLFTTLGEFLATTSQGQYSARLLLLECFVGHLDLLVENFPTLEIVHATIVNFLGYYKRFNKPIQDSLRKGRQAIEKSMEEIVLLASWKDTNIIALRDSAKRSHHKLFKVIHKYRALLAQSAQDVIAQGIPERQEFSKPSSHKAYKDYPRRAEPLALELCRKHIRIWSTKPVRFTNPVSTAENMVLRTHIPSTAIDSASLVESFANDLINNIKILQEETPPSMTKDNGGLVKHLKSRKRKLFADTLKELRRMGFRSNLGADALAKQSSLPIALANSPTFDECSMGDDISVAEYHFHKILTIIPQAKELFRKHSEDLSAGEVARSIGYLDSILSCIMKQRNTSITRSRDLASLDRTIQKLSNLWAPESYTLKRRQEGLEIYAKSVKAAIQWLPGVLDVGHIIIEKHSKLGGSNSTRVLESLRQWSTRIANMAIDYKALPDLPDHVSSSLHEQTHDSSQALLKELRQDLQQWTDEAPHIAFVLNQIKLWTEISQLPSDTEMNGENPVGLAELDSDVSKVVDSILVAVQSIERIQLSIPSSHQDASWLSRTDASITDTLNKSHMRDIRDSLEDAMLKMYRIQTDDGRGLGVAGAIFAIALPIVQQYRDIMKGTLDRYARLHRSTCRLASALAQSFSRVASEGFCMPTQDPATGAGKPEKLEEGTGLGDGEGAEDISKDVQDDEDLSELAQEGQESKDKNDIEDQDDAVNLDHDDLEGELGDASDKDDDNAPESTGEENDLDEEIGDVNDLDPSAVDEKLWDGNGEDAEKEKEGSKGIGETQKDEQMAAEDGHREDVNPEEAGDDENTSQEGAAESEEVAREEMDKIDPHLQEEQNLDLPEEMELDQDSDTTRTSEVVDSDLDGLSDVDQERAGEEKADVAEEDGDGADSTETEDRHPELDLPQEDVMEEDRATGETEDAGSPVDTEPEDDGQDLDKGLLRDKTSDMAIDPDDTATGDVQGLGEDADQQREQEKTQDNRAQGSKGTKGNSLVADDPQASAEDGQLGQAQEHSEHVNRENERLHESGGSQAFKKLGDALEKWHRQQGQIRDAPDTVESGKPNTAEAEKVNREFEHVHDEEAEADTQALGTATEEQAQTLDENALNSEMQDETRDFMPDEVDACQAEDQEDVMQDVDARPATSKNDKEIPGALVGPTNPEERQMHQLERADAQNEEDIGDLDTNLATTHLQAELTISARTPEEARRRWSHYENLTRALSFSLTEQLRLILAPTLATKLRGDFRTGKRLNIKRIIPYIASQYKRDKIWMRRSVPSKRNYQIMLAVDDSKSMGESGSGQLAFETLALVSKSLSMLEVGEICVVGFGESVTVAHEFDAPFSSDAGAHIFQHFAFQQTTTNVRKLVAESISLFREARAKSRNAGADLWQLELIISDGVCEDHEGIRRLVRQAQEEHIMIVFVIVDALRGESIMDMSQAVFESKGGESKLRIKRYLEGFPFAYYLVVGDVKELPGVLATALRQWFAEVVETG